MSDNLPATDADRGASAARLSGAAGRAAQTMGTARLVLWALGFIVATLAILLLVVGRSFFLPLVMALLIQSMLSAGIERLRSLTLYGRSLPNWAASVLAMLLLGLGFLMLYSVLLKQINIVLEDAPVFLDQAEAILLRNVALISPDMAEGLETTLRSFDPRALLQPIAGMASGLLSAIVLMLLYIGFLMAEQPWIRGKIARLFPDHNRRGEIDSAIASIRRNIHHYLWIKTLINVVIACITGVMMWSFGLMFAVPVTIVTFLFLFIPNLGAIVASLLPLVIALVQFDSLSYALVVFASIGAMQFIIGTVIDPMITGSGLQMSSLAIIISLTFWSALWGVAGMFLAVPLMVIIMIISARLPRLEAVAILLSKTGEVRVGT